MEHPRSIPVVSLAANVAAAVLIQSTATALYAIMPVLVRKEFGAGKWEMLAITAPPTVLYVLSIFWNDRLARTSLRKYLVLFWLIASLPMAAVAAAQSYWMVLLPYLLACCGGAGYHPASGDLLKRLYPDASRGRVYGILSGASTAGGALLTFGIGEWMNADSAAFRIFMPIAVGMQLAGCGIFLWLERRAPGERSGRAEKAPPGGGGLASALRPVLHMREALRDDPTFARYEAAYMTYGVGWMIGYALLPMIATDKLGLRYDQFTNSTWVPYQIALVLALIPAGLLLDRLGAIRSTGLSFLLLALYPLGLIGAENSAQLALVSVVYGVAHAGASVGWMLGPVSLAPTRDKVPQYVAIHATLVGLRGAVFQFLGVALYAVTKSFTAPLIVAGLAYLWSSWQMWSLHRRMSRTPAARTPDSSAPLPGK